MDGRERPPLATILPAGVFSTSPKRVFTLTPIISSPLIYIDPGKDEPGLTLQRREGREWMKSLFGREQLPKLYDAYFNKKPVMVNS
jgi:hypothetical protein